MTGLAVLLADGNGRGGGDLYQASYNGKKKEDIKPHEKINSEWTGVNGKAFTVVPNIVGSWAGDRIVISGDYSDIGRFIEEKILTESEIDIINEEGLESIKKARDLNLHTYANLFFKDISEDVIEALKSDSYLKEIFEKKANRYKLRGF